MSSQQSNTDDRKATYIKILDTLEQFYSHYNHTNKLSFESKLASIASVVKNQIPDFFFVGFYIVVNVQDEKGNTTSEEVLEIGPYQSTILATPRIAYGKGVCGTAWEEAKTQLVNNVKACKNYIACDNQTKSEMVLPVIHPTTGKVLAVFDIDSTIQDRFDELDREYLEKITALVVQ